MRRICAFILAKKFLLISFSFLSAICPEDSQSASLASLYRISASIDLDRGNILETIQYLIYTSGMRNSVYGVDHYEAAAVFRSLASNYCLLKRFELALKISTDALKRMKATFGEIHFQTASSYDNLASILTLEAPKKNFLKFFSYIQGYETEN